MYLINIAGVYSALLILFGIFLQLRIIRQRKPKQIGIGSGQDRILERDIRVHGNFVENATFGISALILLALSAAPVLILHAVGLLMVVGRGAHAFGLAGSAGSSLGRVGGMVLTLLALVIASLTLMIRAFM
jgi:uncharacterized protein